MTRIVSFEVHGLSGREDPVSFDLQSDVNVFFGLNGTGKTSLLKILFAALKGRSALLQRVPFEEATVNFWSDKADRVITRKITGHRQTLAAASSDLDELDSDLAISDLQISNRKRGGGWITRPVRYAERAFKIDFITTHRLAYSPSPVVAYRMRNMESMSEENLNELFALEVRQAWRQFNSKLLSEVRDIQSQGLANILQSFFEDDATADGAAVFDKDAFKRASEFLARQGAHLPGTRSTFQTRYESDARLRGVVNKIDGIERDLEAAEQPKRAFQDLVERFISEPKSLVFTDRDITVTTGSGEEIDLTLLSSGEKQLMRLLLTSVTAGGSVVLLDEPELSLHIDWQRQLLEAMRVLNPSAQIIAATHSPEIMADLPDAKIFRL